MYDPILNPKELLRTLGVDGQVSIADFGCGPGIFALPAAELTTGTVYCFDVLSSALEVLQGKIHTYNIDNIVAERANLEVVGGSHLPDAHVDFVFMRKILLQNTHKDVLFAEALRILKPDGTLLVIGWNETAAIGPEVAQRLTKEQVISLAQDAGFALHKELPTDAMHYALTFVKKAS